MISNIFNEREVHEYNALSRQVIRSNKTQKKHRQIIRKAVNSYHGRKRLEKELLNAKLEKLRAEEEEKKLLDAKYKKKTKAQLLESLRPQEHISEMPSNRVIKKRVWNSLNDCWVIQPQGLTITEEAEKLIETLPDGSYKWHELESYFKREEKSHGYFIEVREKTEHDKVIQPQEYLGVWHDKENNNKLSVGFSEWVESRDEAIKRGWLLKQKAVYDCANDRDIRLES